MAGVQDTGDKNRLLEWSPLRGNGERQKALVSGSFVSRDREAVAKNLRLEGRVRDGPGERPGSIEVVVGEPAVHRGVIGGRVGMLEVETWIPIRHFHRRRPGWPGLWRKEESLHGAPRLGRVQVPGAAPKKPQPTGRTSSEIPTSSKHPHSHPHFFAPSARRSAPVSVWLPAPARWDRRAPPPPPPTGGLRIAPAWVTSATGSVTSTVIAAPISVRFEPDSPARA